ncbi:MAG: PEP-CTERM sorting domain-containing protein [Gemmatimonadaceae bacterium]
MLRYSRAVIAALALAVPGHVAAQSFCNSGALTACISVAISVSTTDAGVATVRLDVAAPAGVTVEEIVIREVNGRNLLGGSSTYAFQGSFTGAFVLNASFNLPDQLAALTESLESAEAHQEQLNGQLEQIEGQIEAFEDQLESLQLQLQQAQASGNPGLVAALVGEIQQVQQQLSERISQHQAVGANLDVVNHQVNDLRLQIASLPPEDRFPVLVGNDLTVESWSGVSTNVVPEPASITLLATGLAGLYGWRRRRRLPRA